MLALRYVPLVMLALLAQLVLADHKICSWHDAGDESPSKYYYQHYCLANPKVQNDSHVRYYCPPDDNNRDQDLIADYGWLKPETLEFATPCGGGGYLRLVGDCNWPYIGVCIGDAGPKQNKSTFKCLYMSSHDDCEWPNRFVAGQYPAHVDIWRKNFGMQAGPARLEVD